MINDSPKRRKVDAKTAWNTYYLNSIGVAMKFASITVGAWQSGPSNAIAIPQRNTVTPI